MMKKCISSSILVLVFVAHAFSQSEKTKRFLINHRVSLQIPVSLREPAIIDPMDTIGRSNTKLLLNKQETIMLSCELGDVNNSHAVALGDNEIHEWADKQLSILKIHPNFVYLDDGNFLQGGKNIGYIKFILKQPASNRYYLLFFASIDDRPALFRFSCPAKLQRKWEPIADEIANSLRVIGSELN